MNVGPCKEGDLEWIELSRTSELPMIENAARALKIATVADARESLCVQFGVCSPKEGRAQVYPFPDPVAAMSLASDGQSCLVLRGVEAIDRRERQ